MEEIFENILVPVDGSQQSKNAQDMAAFLAKLFNSKITLFHVISNELLLLSGQMYSPREDFVPVNPVTYQFPRTISFPKPRENIFPIEVVREMTEQYKAIGESALADGVTRFAKAGLAVKEKVVEGNDVAESIISEGKVGDYDLIILGNSGSESSELDLHLGSVAHKVTLRSKKPTLIVRKKREIKKLLVPIEGSAKEECAIQKAQAIADKSGSTAILLHVQEASISKMRPEIREIGLQVLDHASNMMLGTRLEKRLISGDPANTIIQIAEQENVDLIIMNKGGLGTLKRFFLGSVTDHVLHYGTVSVLLT